MATTKMKNYEVKDLFNAIEAMSGRQEVVKDGDGKVLGIVLKPFEFPDYKAQYAMAKTKAALKPLIGAFEEAAQNIRNGLGKEPTEEQKSQANAAFSKLSNDVVEVELFKVDVAKLNIHANKIAASVLGDLMPMIDGELKD